MNEPKNDGRLTRRQLHTSLFTGLLGLAAASMLPGEADAAECAVTAEMMRDAVVGPKGEVGATYCSPTYGGYKEKVYSEIHGMAFVRHTGRDFRSPIGTPVHALASGRVTAVLARTQIPRERAVIVHDGGSTWWIYGHIAQAVAVGQVINRGQVVGHIGDPMGAFKPHVHVGAYKVPLPNRDAAFRAAMGWGRAYGHTVAEVEANVKRYTYDPLLAFARTRGSAC